MKTRPPDEATIRRYLLGHLDADHELVERLNEQILADPELSELVEIVEDEIMEEYLEGTLDPADKQAVETHFLRPPQRQAKMRTARLLNRHLQAATGPSALPEIVAAPRGTLLQSTRLTSHLRTYMEAAAAVLVAASLVWMARSRHESQLRVQDSNQTLVREREHSAALLRQLQDLEAVQQPPTIILSLFAPGIPRGEAALPELRIGTATKTVHVEIALPSASPGPYDVRLESSGTTVWSNAHVQPFISSDGSLLILDVPARALSPNDYRFVLGDQHDRGRTIMYSFRVNPLQ